MVGLIPKAYILHVVGETGEKPITDYPSLIELCGKEGIEFVSTKETKDLKDIIRQYRPEILLIEEEVFNENLNDDSVIYRSKSCQPFILVLTQKGQDFDSTFQLVRAGADDAISRSISEEDAFLKFFSIIRRKNVMEQNQLTNLPSINRSYKVLEHCRQHSSDWAIMHVDILNFQSYGVMYGIAKADQAIRETGRLLQTSLANIKLPEYFLGHLGRDNFLVISPSDFMDDISFALKNDFNEVLKNLYREDDFENQYIISSAPNKVRRKEGLLDLNLGTCTSIDRSFLSGTDIIEQAVKNKKRSEEKNKRVLILEDDLDFASLLEETLIREGNEAKIASGLETLIEDVEKFKPRTLILEASKLGPKNFSPLCQELERFKDEFGLRILVATNISGYQNFLAGGADVYLPKPYDLETLLKEVRRLRYAHI